MILVALTIRQKALDPTPERLELLAVDMNAAMELRAWLANNPAIEILETKVADLEAYVSLQQAIDEQHKVLVAPTRNPKLKRQYEEQEALWRLLEA